MSFRRHVRLDTPAQPGSLVFDTGLAAVLDTFGTANALAGLDSGTDPPLLRSNRRDRGQRAHGSESKPAADGGDQPLMMSPNAATATASKVPIETSLLRVIVVHSLTRPVGNRCESCVQRTRLRAAGVSPVACRK